MAGKWTEEWLSEGLTVEDEKNYMLKKFIKLGKKMFKKGFKCGYNHGLLSGTDNVRTLLLQTNAEFPLSAEEIESIFGTRDPIYILNSWSLLQIDKMIRDYDKKKENANE